MQGQHQDRPSSSSALDHWVASTDHDSREASPPMSQVAFDPADHSGGSSSGHHSHEASLEHALSLSNPPPSLPPTSNSSGLSLAVAAYQSSPRSFDFRNSGSQPSSLRTSFSSYGTSDEALESLRRSYSATSDIRGTLEETRLDGDQGVEQWSINGGSYVSVSFFDRRRASESFS